MVWPGFPSIGRQSSHFPNLRPLTTPLLDKPLVLEFQPNQLITTQLNINLTSKNKAFTSRLILFSFVFFIFAASEHKVDAIPIHPVELHVYNHLDPMA